MSYTSILIGPGIGRKYEIELTDLRVCGRQIDVRRPEIGIPVQDPLASLARGFLLYRPCNEAGQELVITFLEIEVH